ncbi:MAG: hypothetical protein IT279_04575 [Ignavibacteriaceae bacterium]|nr:hypothetical protein [Ignavibacteriaceae bacterium]
MVLLGLLGLSQNNSLSRNTEYNMYNQALFTGTGIAQSLLEEVLSREFDEVTLTRMLTIPDSLTAPWSLGKESGETVVTTFDDVDDYHNYTKTDSLDLFGSFNMLVTVHYIVSMDPDTKSASRTFMKRVDVKMYNIYIADTLTVNGIKAY